MTDPLANPSPLIDRVYAYVAYRIGPGADAEDVTSATFERALRYRSSYDKSKGEPIAWLIGIAQRSLADAITSNPPYDDIVDIADPVDLEERTIERVDLAQAVAKLSRYDRELIALRYGADLKSRQIAALLEQTTSAIDVNLHRALDRLYLVIEGHRRVPGSVPGDRATRTSEA
jgi:RNA polymerase sigma factor (sigma-70 family)